MPGKVLVVDDVPTNRIVLKAKLAASCYKVLTCSSEEDIVGTARATRARLVILNSETCAERALTACRHLRADARLASVQIIVTGGGTGMRALRMQALEAGADAFLPQPIDEHLLLARIRNLMREREISEELRLRTSTSRALGFAEVPEEFARPARVALVAGTVAAARRWRGSLEGKVPHRLSVIDRDAVLSRASPALQDLYVISASLQREGDGLQLMSELRARRWSRHASSLIVLPENPGPLAAMALDLGATDIIEEPVDGRELALRIGKLVARKREGDALRRRVRDGLKLAVTDPLTGLYNRRYALSHLARIRDHAAGTGRPFAVMLLDLDRFKRVNDTHGHAAGDTVLRAVARRIASNLRSVDLVARIGGEEFLVAMPDTRVEEAHTAAQRLCRVIGAQPITLPAPPGATVRQTVSIGVAMGDGAGADEGEALLEALIDRADRALLASKAQGRNTVTLGRDAA